MLKKLKQKIKLTLLGEPIVDTYSMYSYKIITIDNEEYRCNMSYFTICSFKDWVDLCLLKERSVRVANGKLVNREAIKNVELLKVMDSFTYTRVDSISSFRGLSVDVKEAEEIRDKNDW